MHALHIMEKPRTVEHQKLLQSSLASQDGNEQQQEGRTGFQKLQLTHGWHLADTVGAL